MGVWLTGGGSPGKGTDLLLELRSVKFRRCLINFAMGRKEEGLIDDVYCG